MLLARPTETDDAYFANGDGDELWFVQEGTRAARVAVRLARRDGGRLRLGPKVARCTAGTSTPARCGDDVSRRTAGIVVPDEFRNPVGQLRMDAPYTHRDFVRPRGPIATPDRVQEGPRELLVKRAGSVHALRSSSVRRWTSSAGMGSSIRSPSTSRSTRRRRGSCTCRRRSMRRSRARASSSARSSRA